MIFRDTQEAIVDEDTWYVVQKIRETKHRPIAQGKANPLTGLMFCADCVGEFIKFITTVFSVYAICCTGGYRIKKTKK